MYQRAEIEDMAGTSTNLLRAYASSGWTRVESMRLEIDAELQTSN